MPVRLQARGILKLSKEIASFFYTLLEREPFLTIFFYIKHHSILLSAVFFSNNSGQMIEMYSIYHEC